MAYSIQTAVSDGTLEVLDLSIKYMDKSHIYVYVDDVLADGGAYNYLWLTDTRIQVVPAVASGSTLKVIRKTLTDEMWHEFSKGARFSTTSMDENFEQLLFLAQEYSEGIYVSDFYTDIDMHLKRIVNLAAPVNDTDAVNLQTLKEYLPNAELLPSITSRLAAEELKSTLLTQQGIPIGDKVIIGYDTTGLAHNAWVHFAGRSTIGDGGGGYLRFLLGSTLPVNNVTVFAAAGGRLVRDWCNVMALDIRWAGAKCDGVTDDTAAVQLAVDVGSYIYVPEGVTLINVVNLHSNIELFGMGKNSILKQGDGVTGSRGSLYANSGSAVLQLENITIRDLQVLGQVATKGFSEFVHLVSLNGVKNVLINRVYFTGFQGDGLYLGSGISGGDERHNRDIMVVNCQFDGVNNQNRNGLSVIDVDNLVVLNPRFYNCTRPNMPGPIDMEPDGHSFAVMRNVYIHNVVTSNCGGNVGHVALFTPASIAAGASYPLNITIDGVWVYSPKTSQGIPVCVLTGINHNDTTEVNNITIKNVVAYNGTIPFDVRGVKKLTVENSIFVDFTNPALLGYPGAGGANYNVTHRGNTYVRCGKTSGNTGTSVFDIRWLHSHDNTYRDCGTAGGSSGVAMNFNVGTSSGVTLENETYLSTGTMLTAVGKEAGHTFNPATNRYIGNRRGALQNNFQAYLTDDSGSSTNVYDGNTLPTTFPLGTSITVVNGAANIPVGYGQGILKTERYTDTSGFTGWITQYFIPRNTAPVALNEMYWRKSNLDDTGWSDWVKVVATP